MTRTLAPAGPVEPALEPEAPRAPSRDARQARDSAWACGLETLDAGAAQGCADVRPELIVELL